jgi:tryptophan synthase alpha subunit
MTTSIENAFKLALSSRSAAFMPYLTLGFPDQATSVASAVAIAPYCDLFELGVPFSDPLADGPTVQNSTQVALENGTTTRRCLEMVQEIRARGVIVPILLMGYTNPILAYGEREYARDCARAGVNGLIVPDLPPEESESLRHALKEQGLTLIQFLAPTSSPQRIEKVIEIAEGFVYMAAVTGVTGARSEVASSLKGFVSRIKERCPTPIAVGFGISTPAHAQEVGAYADGVIVGSALINVIDCASDSVAAAVAYAKEMRDAL